MAVSLGTTPSSPKRPRRCLGAIALGVPLLVSAGCGEGVDGTPNPASTTPAPPAPPTPAPPAPRSTTPTPAPDSPHLEHHATLTAGLPERPFLGATVGGTEGSTETVGTLALGLNPDAFPVILMPGEHLRVLVAGSRFGAGRIVAFPGQDFLSAGDRATLLGNASALRLLANAVHWTAGDRAAPLRVLVDNPRIADALQSEGLSGIEEVGRRSGEERNWSASALNDADVAVVLVNDWGTARLVADSVAPLRAFVEGGGGLVVAGSARHWNWWIEQHHGPFTGNLLLEDTGIAWNEDSVADIQSATTDVDLQLAPAALWGAYLGGGSVDPGLLPDLFNSALELGRHAELDAALVRLVSDTPALPVSANDPLPPRRPSPTRIDCPPNNPGCVKVDVSQLRKSGCLLTWRIT